MTYPCDKCNQTFDSNYKLYSHKAETHVPAVAIINPTVDSDNERGVKRLLSSDVDDDVGQPPEKVPRIHDRGVKRKRPASFVDTHKSNDDRESKVRKVVMQGVKRLRGSDGGLPDSKSRKVEARGYKRHRGFDVNSRGKRRKLSRNGTKRFRDPDSDSDHKRRRIQSESDSSINGTASDTSGLDYSSDGAGCPIHGAGCTTNGTGCTTNGAGCTTNGAGCTTNGANYSNDGEASSTNGSGKRGPLISKLKREKNKWKQLYDKLRYRMRMDKVEYDDKIKVLKDQLKECEEFGDGEYDLTKMSKKIFNSVTIAEFNRIRKLIANNQIDVLLEGRKNVLALQKMASALTYGVIPVTNPQRVALSSREKNLVKKIENASVDDVKKYIRKNVSVFLRLFSTVEDSLKLVTKTFMKYGFA